MYWFVLLLSSVCVSGARRVDMEIIPSILVHEVHITDSEPISNGVNQRTNNFKNQLQNSDLNVLSSVIAFEHHIGVDNDEVQVPNSWLHAPSPSSSHFDWSNFEDSTGDGSYDRPLREPFHSSQNWDTRRGFRPSPQDNFRSQHGTNSGTFRPSASAFGDFVEFIRRKRS